MRLCNKLSKLKVSKMGRHAKIESTLLHELTGNEARAERTIKIIESQQLKISNLEKELEIQRFLLSSSGPPENQEDYQQIQQELLELQISIRQLKEMQKDILKEVEFHWNKPLCSTPIPVAEVKVDTDACIQTSQSIQKTIINSSTLPPISEQFQEKIKEKLETCNESTLRMGRNLNHVHQNVKWLKQERDEIVSYLEEILDWRKTIDGILLDMCSGTLIDNNAEEEVNVQTASGDSIGGNRKRLWKTARQFFTADQTHFFLTC